MHIPPPSLTIQYVCHCDAPNKQGVCTFPVKPRALYLQNGWYVRPQSCENNKKYQLTFGGKIYSKGKKALAFYDHFKPSMSITGYVYHVTPDLPDMDKNYSYTLIKNSAIIGIDLTAENQGWRCGMGNGEVPCNGKFISAQCDAMSECLFLYSAKPN